MIIVGIDPGYGRVGWGIINFVNHQANYLDCGLIETKSNTDYYNRLTVIIDQVNNIINTFHPDMMAMESVFFNTNAKTAILASQARGAIATVALQKQVPVYDYTPLQVKNTLIGYGRADKKQIQFILKSHLKIPNTITQDDTADALAIALTHAYSYKNNCLI